MTGDERDERVDRILTNTLVPPRLSPGFRASLRRRIDESPHSFTKDALPDVLHLASGAVLTAFAAAAAPFGVAMVVVAGTIATVATYFVLAAVRNSFDESAL